MKFKMPLFIIFLVIISVFFGYILSDSKIFEKDKDIRYLGSSSKELEKLLGKHEKNQKDNYIITTNKKGEVVGVNIHKFPKKIDSISKALVFAEKFLPKDAKLIDGDKGYECSPQMYDTCTIRYHFYYKSDSYIKASNKTRNDEYKGDFELLFYFEFPMHDKNDPEHEFDFYNEGYNELTYMRIE